MITNNDNVTLKIGTQEQVDSERELDAGKIVGQILIGSDTGNMYLNTSDSQTIQLGGVGSTDDTLTLSGQAADAKVTGDRLAALEAALYKPISITSFTINQSARTKEIGDKVTEVTLSWTINRTPQTLILNGTPIDTFITTKFQDGLNITHDNNNQIWTLIATGEKGETSTKTTAKINFYNAVYYGSINADVNINNDIILTLDKDIRNNRKGEFKTTQPSQRGIFICPTNYGTPQFLIGDMPLPYTWEKVNIEPFMLVNAYGYQNPVGYDIWRSYQNIEAKDIKITVV